MEGIAYTVVVTIADEDKARKWLRWLKDGHIAAVLDGGATEARIVLLDPEEPGTAGQTYEIHYKFPDRAAFDAYLADHAPRLRAEGLALFPPEDGFVYRRRVGEVL